MSSKAALKRLLPHQYQDTKKGAQGESNTGQYRSMRDVIVRTYRGEGLKAFYKGLAPNAVRILPGTCVTFVVYENISVSGPCLVVCQLLSSA